MDRVVSLVEHYGCLVILFGVMLESTGVPLPGETILLASGFLVQRGHLDLSDAIGFGILGPSSATRSATGSDARGADPSS
jgi:membrane protein DedA with SNARE-associated domain